MLAPAPDEVERMVTQSLPASRRVWLALYGVLNPVPFGLFVGALAFDITYFRTGEILWDKAAAWLIPLGLIVAIVPRFIDLGIVWLDCRVIATRTDRLDSGLNLVAIACAIVLRLVETIQTNGAVNISAISQRLACEANRCAGDRRITPFPGSAPNGGRS